VNTERQISVNLRASPIRNAKRLLMAEFSYDANDIAISDLFDRSLEVCRW
jgi:hypothetical protein